MTESFILPIAALILILIIFKKRTMRVKILRSSGKEYWYNNLISFKYEVRQSFGNKKSFTVTKCLNDCDSIRKKDHNWIKCEYCRSKDGQNFYISKKDCLILAQ